MEGKEINKSGQHTVIRQKTSRKLSEGMHLSFILKFTDKIFPSFTNNYLSHAM